LKNVAEKKAAAANTISTRALNRAFLARQMLLERHRVSALDAIERLVGLQAQVARPPFVGLWTRLREFKRTDLVAALRDRRAVRVTAMRATLHVMTTTDYIAMRGAMQPMLTGGMESILRGRGAAVDLEIIEVEARKFFGKSAATFDALRDHFKAKFPDSDERAMAYAIRTHVPLVQVPTDAPWAFPAAADFALADRWLSKKVSTVGTPSLATFRDARKRELFDLPDAPRPDEATEAPVRFVPDFDNLVLSHDDRSRIITDAHRGRVTLKTCRCARRSSWTAWSPGPGNRNESATRRYW